MKPVALGVSLKGFHVNRFDFDVDLDYFGFNGKAGQICKIAEKAKS